MKKYIILTLALLFRFNNVYAHELIDMGYNYINENSNYYYDKENYIVNYGEWQDFNGEELENIEIKTFYKYNKTLPVRYIHIYDGGIGTDKLKLSELKIFNKFEEISYKKECVHCNINTIDYLNDNDYTYDKQYEMDFKFGYLTIDLLEEYDIENLNIKIYLNDNSVYLKKYHIGFSTTKEKDKFITTKYFEQDFSAYRKSIPFEYKVDNNWDINYEYVEEYESDQVIENNIFYEKIDEYQKFRTYDIMYKTYMIEEIKKNEIIVETEDNKSNVTKNIIFTPNIEPIKENISTNTNNNEKIVEIENSNEDIKENPIKVIENSTYKEVKNYKTNSNKSFNTVNIIIYILIIISTLIMLILLNRKKLSYEK